MNGAYGGVYGVDGIRPEAMHSEFLPVKVI